MGLFSKIKHEEKLSVQIQRASYDLLLLRSASSFSLRLTVKKRKEAEPKLKLSKRRDSARAFNSTVLAVISRFFFYIQAFETTWFASLHTQRTSNFNILSLPYLEMTAKQTAFSRPSHAQLPS